jgi:hypothetical protein
MDAPSRIAFRRWAGVGLGAAGCLWAQPTATPTIPVDSLDRIRTIGPGARHMAPSSAGSEPVPLDSARVRRRLESMVDTAVARGFLTARATATSVVRTDSGLELVVETEAGSRSVWGELRDLGNASLTPKALGRIGRLPRARPADPADLLAAVRRLEQTGYVESIAPPRLRRIPRTALVDGWVSLRDIPASFVEAAAAWERDGQATGYLETRLANMLGTARDLNFGISQGEQGTRAHLWYKEPWVGTLPMRLELGGSLANDSLSQALEGAVSLVWPFLDGRLGIGAGLSGARRAERLPDDSLFGPTRREFGTRFSLSGRRHPLRAWPVGDVAGKLEIEAATLDSDTGSGARLRVRTGLDVWTPFGPAVARTGAQARGIWPLDRSAGLSEALAPGGIEGWRGWPEGSPRSPSWAWGVLQAGIGSPRTGGVFGFWEPGVRALRRQDLGWDPTWGWSGGVGFSGQLPSWMIEMVIAVRDDTPTWQDALLQVRARNRF